MNHSAGGRHQFSEQPAHKQQGWWRSRRFLLARRICQLLVLLLFLSGPLFGIWILRGNYSGSLLLDRLPLTDPLILLQSLVTGYWPETLAWVGGVTVTVGYALLGSRVFCGWICPLNPLTDLAAWLRRKWRIRSSATLPRHLRYAVLVMVLFGSAVSGVLLWEWINPVAIAGRGLIGGLGSATTMERLLPGVVAGFWAGIWLLVAIFLFDLLVVEHGWCGYLCPLGALYAVIGAKGQIRISAEHRQRCNRCMKCLHICPEPQVLREPLLGKQTSPLVLDKECISCGRCVDVCSEQVFTLRMR